MKCGSDSIALSERVDAGHIFRRIKENIKPIGRSTSSGEILTDMSAAK